MANIKSAKKRILVNRTKAERNKSIKSAVKTSIKKVEAAVAAQDKEAPLLHCRVQFLPSTKQRLRVFTIRTTPQEKFPAYPKP